VLPSIWPETFSIVLREALSAGLPVVASRIGAIPELIRDGENGLLVTPGSVDDLAAALERLAREPALRQRLVAVPTPIRSVADYAAELEQIYREVLGSKSRESRTSPS
jgi:glycogen(starch) synthase